MCFLLQVNELSLFSRRLRMMVCNDLPYALLPCSARKGSKTENYWSPALDLNFSIFRYVSGLCIGVTLLTCQCSWLHSHD